jgi:hypothetical protein
MPEKLLFAHPSRQLTRIERVTLPLSLELEAVDYFRFLLPEVPQMQRVV